MDWVYTLPTWLFALMVTSLIVLASIAVQIVFRRFVSGNLLAQHSELAGYIAAMVGVIFAVLLSFVVVLVWQQYDAAGTNANHEAGAVADLLHITYELPEPLRNDAQRDLLQYARLMLSDEWPQMNAGHFSVKAEELAHHIFFEISDFIPRTSRAANLQASALTRLNVFFDARRERLHDNIWSLPGILWTSLIAGAALTIGFTFFFSAADFRVHLVMTAGLAILIAVLFVLIIELDFPFRGGNAIAPTMWSDVLQRYHGD